MQIDLDTHTKLLALVNQAQNTFPTLFNENNRDVKECFLKITDQILLDKIRLNIGNIGSYITTLSKGDLKLTSLADRTRCYDDLENYMIVVNPL